MENLPDFVKENETERSKLPALEELTGWETVIFQLDDEPKPD